MNSSWSEANSRRNPVVSADCSQVFYLSSVARVRTFYHSNSGTPGARHASEFAQTATKRSESSWLGSAGRKSGIQIGVPAKKRRGMPAGVHRGHSRGIEHRLPIIDLHARTFAHQRISRRSRFSIRWRLSTYSPSHYVQFLKFHTCYSVIFHHYLTLCPITSFEFLWNFLINLSATIVNLQVNSSNVI